MTSVRPKGQARLAGLVAAALVAAAGLVGLSSGPAAAALCSGNGVNVVVDFQGLGGGVQKGCDPSGAGKSGNKVFPAAGFSLTYAARQPGFVCRVKGSPSNAPCQNTSPANAYWGLYWSNGKSGKWTYSSSGVGGISVPNGGFLAFSWQNGGPSDPPGAAPVNSSKPAATKSPTKKATPKAPTKKSTKQADAGSQSTKAPGQTTPDQPTKTSGAAGAGTPKAKASKRARAKARASASRSPSASSSPSESAASEASDDASPDVTSAEKVDSSFAPEEDPGGLPVWVPVVVIVALAGSAGGAAWWRRRTGAS
jgi:hypothetical protein